MYNEFEDEEEEDEFSLIRQNIKKNNRDLQLKKYYWKKKSSLGTSPSPKKE